MPAVSTFYGIVTAMFFDDHPPPHFHVRYAEHHARVTIPGGEVLDGSLPPRAARLVRRWARLHQDELEENWRRVRRRLHPARIEPLP